MVSIPIEWRLGIKGSDEVKSELDQLSMAFNKAKMSGNNYGKEQRALSTAVNRRINEDRLQNNLLLAQHPMILKASRAMSTLTSITRTLLTIQNALNLARIANATVDIAGMEIQSQLNAALRERAELEAKGLKGTKEWIENEEEINILLGKQKEHIEDVKNTNFNDWITTISTVLFGAASAFSIVKGHLKDIGGILRTLGPAVGIVGGVFAAIATAVAFAAEEMYKFLFNVSDMDAWRAKNVEALFKFFTQDIPIAIGQAGVALTQFFLTDLPNWAGQGLAFLSSLFVNTWNSIIMTTNAGVNAVISGVNHIINSAIEAINSFIRAINNILKKAKLGTISLIPKFSGIPPINIPTIAAAKGFDGMVNSPTMFLAGEAGQEHVEITPSGGKGSSSGNTIIINVAGSVVTEKKLAYMVDQIQKQNLKSRGFTGFG